MAAATRTHRIRTDAIVLATGGIAGGGLVGTQDGRLVEPLLGLPVDAPDRRRLARGRPARPGRSPDRVGGRPDRRCAPPARPGHAARRARTTSASRGPAGRPAGAAGALRRRGRDRQRLARGRRRSAPRPPGPRVGREPLAHEDDAVTIADLVGGDGGTEHHGRSVGRRVPQVQRLQHGLPGRAGHGPVPGPEVRRSAGAALPAGPRCRSRARLLASSPRRIAPSTTAPAAAGARPPARPT